MKMYARQISPEYQESPLFWGDECFPEDIILTGNRQYNSHTTKAWDRLSNAEDAADQIRYIQDRSPWACYNTVTDALNDILTRDDGKGYTTRQVHAWKKLLEDWQDTEREKALALELITGTPYDWHEIRGTCQGEWQMLFCPEDWTPEAVQAFEIEYFNMGTEWIIHDEEADPEGPEDVQGYGVYAHGWNVEEIRKELAEIAGCNPEELTLWAVSGCHTVTDWEEVA